MTLHGRKTTGGGPASPLAIALPIVLVSLVGISLSLTMPLLALRMERMGVGGLLNGLNTATAGFANMLVVPFVPGAAARWGLRRLILGATLMGLACTLLFEALPFPFWFPLRFLLGASLGTLFVLAEYWINAQAPPQRRGLVMGVYATVLALGFAAGPLLLALTGTESWPPFILSAGLFTLALLPLLASRGQLPDFSGERGSAGGVFRIVLAAPVATLAALIFGAVETSAFGLLPVYGTRLALSAAEAARLVSLMAAGGVLFQLPLGWLSDRLDRRLLLVACGTASIVLVLLLPVLDARSLPFAACLVVFGGVVGSLYTVGLAHLGQRYAGRDLAGANAAFVMLYSAGLTAGPPLAGAAMDLAGPQGLPLALAAMLGLYVATALARILTLRPS